MPNLSHGLNGFKVVPVSKRPLKSGGKFCALNSFQVQWNLVHRFFKQTLVLSVDSFRNISADRYRYQLLGKTMTDILNAKEITHHVTLEIPMGIKECSFGLYCLRC